MAKLVVVALLGMLALAAAADVAPQKKTYKSHEEEHSKDYTPHYNKANVKASHKVWDLVEDVKSTHPCRAQYEILGSTVSQSAELKKPDDDKTVVGNVYWSGIVTHHDTCGHCKDYKAKTEHIVKINYQIIFEFLAEHKGQIVCAVSADSIFSEESVTCGVLGGTGAFEGAWGSIKWTAGATEKDNGKYSFDIYLPKIHDVKEYKDYKEYKSDSKNYDDEKY
jgi:hypothetical protein